MVGHQRKGLVRQVAQRFLGHLKQRDQLPPARGSVVDLRVEGLQLRLIFSGKCVCHILSMAP
jgi:hypothetical protein